MFADPEANLAHVSLRPQMRVIDLGAGSGGYTLPIAKKIADDNGVVYAVEVQKDILERLKSESLRLGITNIETLWADIEQRQGIKLPDNSIDLAIVSNVLFQVESQQGLVAEVKRLLKPGGQLLLIDWADSFSGMGPHPGAVVSEASARALFADAGFGLKESFSAGDHHYGLVLIKQ